MAIPAHLCPACAGFNLVPYFCPVELDRALHPNPTSPILCFFHKHNTEFPLVHGEDLIQCLHKGIFSSSQRKREAEHSTCLSQTL